MKKILLFAGLPGVGKSTISRVIGSRTGAVIVDVDDFKKLVVDPNLVTEQIDPPDVRWAYYEKALAHIFDIFKLGVSIVIMDEVFHLDSLRIKLEDLCAGQNIEVLWIEVRCSRDVVEQRLRASDRRGHILSTEQALAMNLLFEKIFEKFPNDQHNHIVIDNGCDADIRSLIESILQRI
jgi:predicted kinase